MCGIYGTTKKYTADVLKRKVERFAFRGPDYSGLKHYAGEKYKLVLAHNRLAIIDLNARANQPMEYDNGNIVVVLNGEIYNFHQLKAQYFTDKVFKTESDTEVLCVLYERFGKDFLCVKRRQVAFPKIIQGCFHCFCRKGFRPVKFPKGVQRFRNVIHCF